MNDLILKIIVAISISVLISYIIIGLIRFWSRSDKFILLHKYGVSDYSQYFLSGLALIATLSSLGLVTLILYQAEVLHYSLFAALLLCLLIVSPRFILDISRGLKYNAKTGELARIKELEDQLKNK